MPDPTEPAPIPPTDLDELGAELDKEASAEAKLTVEGEMKRLNELAEGKPDPRVRTVSRGSDKNPSKVGPDGIAEVDADELGVNDPTTEVSKHIEYLFYKCTNPGCGKTVFAGGADSAPRVRCQFCFHGEDEEGKAKRGVMQLTRFKKLRYPKV